MNKKILLIAFFPLLFYCHLSYSQHSIRGFVIDSTTQEPIEGAAIFLDKTTYGTISNKRGFFVLKVEKQTKAPLIIQHLGYEKGIYKEPPINQNIKFVIHQKDYQLEEVMISANRVEKSHHDMHLSLFKRLFLGQSKHIDKVKIENTDDLEFLCSSDELEINVQSKKPLIIKNEYLGYEITYYLETFTVFRKLADTLDSPIIDAYQVAGTALYKNLDDPEKVKNKYKRRRNRVYEGSLLHLMRSIYKNEISEEGFLLKNNHHDTLLERKEHDSFVEILPPPKIVVSYKNYLPDKPTLASAGITVIEFRQNFGIDQLGNFFPWQALHFEGKMGLKGMAEALPLNFTKD